jgi:hypothetical protein
MLERYHDGLTKCGFRKLNAPRDVSSFAAFYSRVPFRYPPLFEDLCIAYSWTEAVVGEVQFAANPGGADLQALRGGGPVRLAPLGVPGS